MFRFYVFLLYYIILRKPYFRRIRFRYRLEKKGLDQKILAFVSCKMHIPVSEDLIVIFKD